MPSTTFISAVILIFQNFSVPPYPALSLTFYVSFSRCSDCANAFHNPVSHSKCVLHRPATNKMHSYFFLNTHLLIAATSQDRRPDNKKTDVAGDGEEHLLGLRLRLHLHPVDLDDLVPEAKSTIPSSKTLGSDVVDEDLKKVFLLSKILVYFLPEVNCMLKLCNTFGQKPSSIVVVLQSRK